MKSPTSASVPAPFRKAGFTLIELLVSMGITSVLMIALLSLVGTSTESLTQTQRSLNSISQARAFIQFFDRELSTRLPGTPLIHEVNIAAAGPSASDRIAFVRTLTDDEQVAFAAKTPPEPGDLGTSIYYVAYTDDARFAPCYSLYRRSLGPEETQEIIESAVTSPDPAFPDATASNGEPIIPNIVDLEVKPKYRDSVSGDLEDWEITDDESPEVIDLLITVFDESAARRYTTQSEWDRIATSPRDNELQFIRTFTRSIQIAK